MGKTEIVNLKELRERFIKTYGEGSWATKNTGIDKAEFRVRKGYYETPQGAVKVSMMKLGLDLGLSVEQVANLLNMTNHQVQTAVAQYKL